MTDPMPEVGDPYDDATVADYDDAQRMDWGDDQRDYAEERANAALLRDESELDDWGLGLSLLEAKAVAAERVNRAQTTARMWKDANDAWRQRARTAEALVHGLRVERDDLVARLNAADPFRGLPGCEPYVAKAEPTAPIRPLTVIREAGPLRPSTSGRDQAVGESSEDYDLRDQV